MEQQGIIVGITGPSGSGKTTVSNIISKLGFPVINADQLSREVTQPGSECLSKIAEAFGLGILLQDGSLDRAKLGEIVFNDQEKREYLQDLIFPYIVDKMQKETQNLLNQNASCVFWDAPTLLESAAKDSCYKIIAVLAPESLRLKRIMGRDDLTREQAMDRISSQYLDSYYQSGSDYVIQNHGDTLDLKVQILHILSMLNLV